MYKKLRIWRKERWGHLMQFMVRKKHVRGTWVHRVLGERIFAQDLWRPSRHGLAVGLAIGTFFAFVHLPGVQMVLAALLAYYLRGNIPVAVTSTWIVNPLIIPFVLWLQYDFGRWLLGMEGGWDAGLLKIYRETAGMEYMERLKILFHELGKIIADAPAPLILGVGITSVFFAACAYLIGYFGWDIAARMRRSSRMKKQATRTQKI